MAIRRISVPILSKESVDSVLDCALKVALPFGARIDARFIRPDAGDAALYDAGFGFASASLINQIESEGAAAATTARQRCDAWCGRHPERPPVDWSEEEGHIGTVVARRGCLADVILLQRAGRRDAAIDEAFEAAVFGAGRLALVTDQALPDTYLDHALIAWNESTEASRAVAQSLPFLAKAGKVSVFSAAEADGQSADRQGLVDYLALQDITAEILPDHTVTTPIGTGLLRVARAERATLLVMGAYTHNRVRQLLFGGVTQHILTTAGLPALLAH